MINPPLATGAAGAARNGGAAVTQLCSFGGSTWRQGGELDGSFHRKRVSAVVAVDGMAVAIAESARERHAVTRPKRELLGAELGGSGRRRDPCEPD